MIVASNLRDAPSTARADRSFGGEGGQARGRTRSRHRIPADDLLTAGVLSQIDDGKRGAAYAQDRRQAAVTASVRRVVPALGVDGVGVEPSRCEVRPGAVDMTYAEIRDDVAKGVGGQRERAAHR